MKDTKIQNRIVLAGLVLLIMSFTSYVFAVQKVRAATCTAAPVTAQVELVVEEI